MRQIELIHKDKIRPYENNPRNNTEAVAKVAESIREFGFTNPLILDKDYNIIAGHTRFKAGQTLSITEYPCIIVSDLSEAQTQALRLIDNRTAEYAEWDTDLLNKELQDLINKDYSKDLLDFFDFPTETDLTETDLTETDLINKLSEIEYTPKLEKAPAIKELTDTDLYDELILKIETAEIEAELKEFLKLTATRFINFNFDLIAEYYAHANKDTQEIMEYLRLVIVDMDNAIKNGILKHSKLLNKIGNSDYV